MFWLHVGHISVHSRSSKGPDAETLYRFAVGEAIQLFDSQETQINFTKVHFINVWGAEDKEVQKIIAKLNSMKTFLSQKINILQNKLAAREINQGTQLALLSCKGA